MDNKQLFYLTLMRALMTFLYLLTYLKMSHYNLIIFCNIFEKKIDSHHKKYYKTKEGWQNVFVLGV